MNKFVVFTAPPKPDLDLSQPTENLCLFLNLRYITLGPTNSADKK